MYAGCRRSSNPYRWGAVGGYAVVLATADDEGRKLGDEALQPRARQNVILELGYFIGLLGRDRVALLYEDTVELPSDMNGVLYERFDEQGAWKAGVMRELREAGYRIDASKG